MSTKLLSPSSKTNLQSLVDDSLIEKLWLELNGQVEREQIIHTVNEIAITFQDATVKAFVPILIQRKAMDHFRKSIKKKSAK